MKIRKPIPKLMQTKSCWTCADRRKPCDSEPCKTCLASPIYNRSHWKGNVR